MSKSGFTFEYSSYTKDLVIYQKKTIGLSDGYKQKKINHHLVMYWMGEKRTRNRLAKGQRF